MYDDDRDALAAEYVLGTLAADERDQAEALLAIDPGFAEIVRVWERRLGELNVMVEAVEPPADVWDKIRTEIGGSTPHSSLEPETGLPEESAPQMAPEAGAEGTPATKSESPPDVFSEPMLSLDDLAAPRDLEEPQDLDKLSQDLEGSDDSSAVAALASSLLPSEPEPASQVPASPEAAATPTPAAPPKFERSADIIYLARAARRWRGYTAAVGAIAALLAIYIGIAQFAPGLIPLGLQSQPVAAAATQPPSSRLVAVLQQEPTAPAFLLTVDPQNRTLTVRTVTAAADANRSYELWLISSKYTTPRSLGLVGGEQFTTRPIPANFDADTLRTASYAVSLEPAGGSPKGVPTGPILFTGKMVESLPGSPS
jgi:anti-sigma-K factor RskA